MPATTIQVRIDSKIKREAKRAFEGMGLDLSSGVKLLLQNVVNRQALPDDMRTVNGYTRGQEQRILRNVKDAELNEKGYTDMKKMLAEI